MAKVQIEEQNLKNIADAIRENKTAAGWSSKTFTPTNMYEAIKSIGETLTLDNNRLINYKANLYFPSHGRDLYRSVSLNFDPYTVAKGWGYGKIQPTKYMVSVSEPTTITPDEGYDGLQGVQVIPPEIYKGEHIINANGTYTAPFTHNSINYPGVAKIVVNVPSNEPTQPYIEETYDANGNLTAAVMHGYAKVRDKAFYGCTNLAQVTLPSGLTEIGGEAFYYCGSLTLAALPSGLTKIQSSAFHGCSELALISLPSGITSIGLNAFNGCKSLNTLRFKGKPNSIGETAFLNCTNLTDIKVPWAEGEVTGAPWGATNATITYNYTEDTEEA